MFPSFRTILIGADQAKRAAFKIGEFDYLSNIPFSVSSIVNSTASEKFMLVNSGWQWHDLPVFKNIQDSIIFDKNVDSAVVCVNAKHVLEWVKKILEQKSIKNITILAEDVPERDAWEMISLAKEYHVNIVGPSSTGIVVAGRGRLGEIGGDFKNLQLCKLDKLGQVGLITKSGGMSGELMWVISQHSKGLSTAVQIGGDTFPTTDFVYWLEKFSHDENTKVVVMAGEAGGDLEERAASWYREYLTANRYPLTARFKLIACISGKFLEHMTKGQKFGHAGAKQEESGYGSAKKKIEILQNAGVEVVPLELLGKRLSEL